MQNRKKKKRGSSRVLGGSRTEPLTAEAECVCECECVLEIIQGDLQELSITAESQSRFIFVTVFNLMEFLMDSPKLGDELRIEYL